MKKNAILLSLLLGSLSQFRFVSPNDDPMQIDPQSESAQENNEVQYQSIKIPFATNIEMRNFRAAIRHTSLENELLITNGLVGNFYMIFSFDEPRTQADIEEEILGIFPNFDTDVIEYHRSLDHSN
jgi:hypothetical protein